MKTITTVQKQVARSWPLGPNGFGYTRMGRERVCTMYWLGRRGYVTRYVLAAYIRAVRRDMKRAVKIKDEGTCNE